MRLWGKVGVLLLIMSFLALSSASLAQGRQQQHRDRDSWSDRWDDSHDDHPPGWDKGKKTGWRGEDEPPGQAKKHRHSHKERHKSRNHDGRSEPRVIFEPSPR